MPVQHLGVRYWATSMLPDRTPPFTPPLQVVTTLSYPSFPSPLLALFGYKTNLSQFAVPQ